MLRSIKIINISQVSQYLLSIAFVCFGDTPNWSKFTRRCAQSENMLAIRIRQLAISATPILSFNLGRRHPAPSTNGWGRVPFRTGELHLSSLNSVLLSGRGLRRPAASSASSACGWEGAHWAGMGLYRRTASEGYETSIS